MEYLLVGKIVGTHGIKGELKVKSETSFPEQRYKKGSKLFLKVNNTYKQVTISSHRIHKGLDLITIDDLFDINLVENYIGLELYIDKASLQKLDEDDFYFDDLISLKVYEGDQLIGEVVDVLEVPQGAILIINQTNQKRTLIPFHKEFIKEIDLEKQIMMITSIEGLL